MQCSHLGYILQLILKHIISSSAIQWSPAASIWTISNNSTCGKKKGTSPHPPKKIRKTDSCQSSWVFYILPYCRTMCPLCIQAPPAYLWGEEVGGFAPEVASAWYLSEPAMSYRRRRCEVYLNSSPIYSVHHPPTLSLSLWVLLLSQHQRGTAFTKKALVNRALCRTEPLREPVVIYPDSGCHSLPGSRLPAFSLVAPLPSMTEKISMLHTESLSYNKKKGSAQ